MIEKYPIAKKKVPLIKLGKNIWGKLKVFLTIRSIYPNGTNYNKLLLNYGENLWEKLIGKNYGENLCEELMGRINGEK